MKINVTQPEKNSLETILVVEDDPIALRVVSEILVRAGFCVLVAGSGAQAIQMESMTQGTIHLLLSDVKMPDMSGPVVGHALKKLRPEMRVIFMSGYPDGDMVLLNYGWHFIEKPFLPVKLVEKVNDILHTPERSQGDDQFDTRIHPEASGSRG